ncbi:hypothetical protein PN36_35015, partial [Candidatus Thiomargarita nelsonii]
QVTKWLLELYETGRVELGPKRNPNSRFPYMTQEVIDQTRFQRAFLDTLYISRPQQETGLNTFLLETFDIDTSKFWNNPPASASDAEKYFTPTSLALKLKMAPFSINPALIRLGLQSAERTFSGKILYTATSKGRPYLCPLPSGSCIYWKLSVLPLLQSYFRTPEGRRVGRMQPDLATSSLSLLK